MTLYAKISIILGENKAAFCREGHFFLCSHRTDSRIVELRKESFFHLSVFLPRKLSVNFGAYFWLSPSESRYERGLRDKWSQW